jgi:hypothetical protein
MYLKFAGVPTSCGTLPMTDGVSHRRYQVRPVPGYRVREPFKETGSFSMPATAHALQGTQTVVVKPTGLAAALKEISAKREADLIRFRTCCADPRASK